MAPRLVSAIATHGKARVMRERREQVQDPEIVRGRHFRAIFFLEGSPLPAGTGVLRRLDQRGAGRKVREPDVVPVSGREFGLGNPAWRTPYRADAQSLACFAVGTEPNEAHSDG